MTAVRGLKQPFLKRHGARLLSALRHLVSAALKEQPRQQTVNAQAARMLDTYGNSILRLAYSYLHNQSDAEEVLQDTLLQVLRTAPVLESPQHEKAWLLRVAANLSKNRLKYNRLRDTDELSEQLVAEQREDLSFVWEAVKALPVPARVAIHLFYQEGCSTAQIASILGRKESTVRSDLRRGRLQLKQILKEAYDFGPEL
uniref:RNA polymerase sigma factor n=1 Tax=uncultured Flavonifractor sp. TaxID=1193534 RepID=UPI00261DA107|nr:sigma-70 family RNA polymerase sigma factor [uncultured Flavonifractor sp.]